MLLYLLFVCAVTRAQTWEDLVPGHVSVPTTGRAPEPRRHHLDARIIGGDEAVPHDVPSQVALYLRTYSQSTVFCGGSLITATCVMTAAHCLENVYVVTAIMGAHNVRVPEESQVRVETKEFVRHELYDREYMANDIAVVKLPKSVALNAFVNVVELPSRAQMYESFLGETAVVTGWGMTSDVTRLTSPVLRWVASKIISNYECMSFYSVIMPCHMCVDGAGRKSACRGDSGGPLFIRVAGRKVQVGIVSCGSIDGCEKGYPSIYTRVASYLYWLQEHSDVKLK